MPKVVIIIIIIIINLATSSQQAGSGSNSEKAADVASVATDNWQFAARQLPAARRSDKLAPTSPSPQLERYINEAQDHSAGPSY